MGRLSGFKYREIAEKFRRLGWEFERNAKGSHEIWRHPPTGRRATLINHPGDIAEGTLRAILRSAGIDIDEFLNA